MSGLRLHWRPTGLGPAAALVAMLATALLATALLATPAQAAQTTTRTGVFLQVNPNTIQAGFQIGLRASCGEDLNPATVRSSAFGEVTLMPHRSTGLLTGAVMVPATTRPGDYPVRLVCVDGATASAELFVLDMHRPTRGPDTGGGGTAAGIAAGVTAVLFATGGMAALGAGATLLLRARRPG